MSCSDNLTYHQEVPPFPWAAHLKWKFEREFPLQMCHMTIWPDLLKLYCNTAFCHRFPQVSAVAPVLFCLHRCRIALMAYAKFRFCPNLSHFFVVSRLYN